MINGLQGIPGSGKSYEASVFQVLEALKQGRKVITNLPLILAAYTAIDPTYASLIEMRYAPGPVRGVWNPEAVDPETGQGSAFTLFDDRRQEPAPEGARVFGTVWCYWSDWKHPKTGHGPLFVVDECHVAMPKNGTDRAVIEWYKLHRHFNCDVLLATQNFRQMSLDIAELMAMVIKVRKADVLGRSDQYIRKVHAGYRGAVIQESIRNYERHFFALYRSHTQGNAVLEAGASDVAPLSVKIKRWTRGVWAVAALACVMAVWVWTKEPPPKVNGNPYNNPIVRPDGKTDFKALDAIIKREAERRQREPWDFVPPAQEEPVPLSGGLPEPYGGKGLHLTGHMVMGQRQLYTFAVSMGNARIADVTSEDLHRAGYRWEALTDCAGYLHWQGNTRAVTCDAPRAMAGSDERPIVMRDGYGSDGRVPAGRVGSTSPPPMDIM